MKLNIINLLQNQNIPTKKNSIDWIQVKCPFPNCHDKGFHGGFNLTEKNIYYTCFKCGWHSIVDVIMQLTNTDFPQAIQLIQEFSDNKQTKYKKEPRQKVKKLKLPYECKNGIGKPHKNYLIKRGFKNPNKLSKQWNLHHTNKYSNYKWRIIAPIYFNNKLVSFQGRDITNKSDTKYKACSKEKEIIHHKELLYGFDKVPGKSVIVCEGIIDVWKLGYGAMCTFGIKYTWPQVELLSEFDNVYILFDSEETAQKQAIQLVHDLLSLDVNASLLILNEGDPGQLTEKQGRKVIEKYLT